MKNVMGVLGLLVVLTTAGCKTTEPKADVASAEAVREEKAVEYFPLVPEVKWDELNGLQKTTAAIAIVPGCILSACANAYLWVVN